MGLQKPKHWLVQCLLNSLTTWFLHSRAIPILSTTSMANAPGLHPLWHPGHSGECDLRDLMLPKWLPLRKWTGRPKMASPAFFMNQYCPNIILAVTGLVRGDSPVILDKGLFCSTEQDCTGSRGPPTKRRMEPSTSHPSEGNTASLEISVQPLPLRQHSLSLQRKQIPHIHIHKSSKN